MHMVGRPAVVRCAGRRKKGERNTRGPVCVCPAPPSLSLSRSEQPAAAVPQHPRAQRPRRVADHLAPPRRLALPVRQAGDAAGGAGVETPDVGADAVLQFCLLGLFVCGSWWVM